MSIIELSKESKLAYNKTADYVYMLEKEGLIQKEREGKNAVVRCTVNRLSIS